ncbi:DNA internalization-related competence protein ComEC/Rec2 [Streptococcus salivarius]|uniref:DNA internalization-related competence protein ComEC/Rec2 n=2 Tax=Lactobacillales TaxID=186826 RepID=UPI0012BC3B45|nr:DNA internalization-related competence protein ComEC/Rec2 [Streptococcus salivarius]MTR24441.1 DNA internalization-related competence protein ComEC/Rec2 [Streptococcus salivarius]MTR42923.1 DNA internalization-related competence protein ComEC/Rec2 [Streptococcus salivarius]
MWLKKAPINLFSLALLIATLYFTIFVTNVYAIGVLSFLLVCFLKHHWKNKAALKLVGLVGGFFLIYFLFLHHRAVLQDKQAPAEINQVTLVADTLSVNGEQLSAIGKAKGQTYQVFYRLKSEKEQHFFKTTSQTLVLKGKIKLSPATGQRNFQGFNYQSYLASQGIYRMAQIERLDHVVTQKNTSPLAFFHQLRRRALVHIQTHFPNPMRHYMTGLLFGYLDKEFDEQSQLYTSLGIIHLFALSGMQVGFFLGWFRYGLLRLGLPKDYLFIILLPFSVCYGLMTGWTASVLRSLIQSLLAEFGIKKLDNMGITLLLMFLFLPHFLLTVGGVLSCSYAFLLCLFDFEEMSSLKKSICTSLVLSLGILPFLTYYYGTFQPVSLILTAMFSIVFDSFLLPVLTVFFALSGLLVFSQINPLFEWMEAFLTWIQSWIGQPLILGKPSLFQFGLMIAVLVMLFDFWKKPQFRICLLMIFGLLMVWVKHPLTNEVTMVDVGQGDSIFLRSMKGDTILIDVGGKVTFGSKEKWQEASQTSNAEKTLIPYLQARGVSQIDHMVLTHTDTDHIGDLEEVAKRFKIKEICVSQGALTKPSFVKRLRTLKRPVRTLKAGDNLPMMGSKLQVLYPNKVGDGGNNDSIVLYGKLLGSSFLFTGDLEKEGEEELMASYPNLKAGILKAGHHGSKGSSSEAFLDQLQPSLALVSAGENNRYKHPNDETLKRFKERHIKVLRTDQNGAIRFKGWFKWSSETVR